LRDGNFLRELFEITRAMERRKSHSRGWFGRDVSLLVLDHGTPVLTGYDLTREENLDVEKIFNEVHDSFALEIRNDPEMLYTVGLMAELSPWALGDENGWIACSLEYRNRYELLEPNGLDPELFEGRGEYGKYFAHQIRYAREHPRT
jgi:hypothetical protein